MLNNMWEAGANCMNVKGLKLRQMASRTYLVRLDEWYSVNAWAIVEWDIEKRQRETPSAYYNEQRRAVILACNISDLNAISIKVNTFKFYLYTKKRPYRSRVELLKKMSPLNPN